MDLLLARGTDLQKNKAISYGPQITGQLTSLSWAVAAVWGMSIPCRSLVGRYLAAAILQKEKSGGAVQR